MGFGAELACGSRAQPARHIRKCKNKTTTPCLYLSYWCSLWLYQGSADGYLSGFCNTFCFCTPPCICVHQSLTCQKVIPSVCSASLPSCHARCSRCSRSGQKPYASTWGEHDSKVTLEMQLGTSLGAWSVHPWGHCWLGRNIKTIEQGTVPLALQDPTPVVQGFSKTFSS